MSYRIMTADDSASVRRMVSFARRGAGYEVVEAVDGKDAPAKLALTPIQMFIADLNIPKLDDIGLVRMVRANLSYKFIPIIMLTTESQGSKKQEGKFAGPKGWIVKPFRPEQLTAVVKKVQG